MQSASTGFGKVMLLADQPVAQRILLTLPAFRADGVTAIPSSYADVSDCVVSIKSDVAVTTTVPEGTLQINGYSAAGATLVLSGPLKQAFGVPPVDSQSVYWLCNPNDVSSPLWGISLTGMAVTLQEGRWVSGAIEWITIGTLIIDTCATSNGAVTLTLIDGRNSVRGPAVLPPVYTAPPTNAGLTSEYAVDYLFRYAAPSKYLSRPAQRSNCILSVGCRASIWPEVGSYTAFDLTNPYVLPIFGTGAFGTALTNGPSGNEPAYSVAPPVVAGGTVFIEFWASGEFDISLGDGADTWLIDFSYVDATHVNVTIQSTSGFATGHTFTVTDTTGFHYYGLLVSCAVASAAVSGTLFYDTSTFSYSFTALDNRPSVTLTMGSFGVGGLGGTIEAVQMTTETSPASNGAFSPTLKLDPSLNPLTALPDVSGKDIWPVLQDIAAAEAAVINIDEVNVAHFVNRNTIAAKTSVLTASSRVNVTSFDSLDQLSMVATHVQVPYNPLQIGPLGWAWISADVVSVPGNGITQFFATTSNPVLNITTTDSGFWIDGDTVGNTWWRACTTADGSGATVRTGIRVWVQQMSATRLRIAVVNSNPFTAYMCNPTEFTGGGAGTGSGFIVVGGQQVLSVTNPVTVGSAAGGGAVADSQWPPLITASDGTTTGGATTNPRGDILLPVPANDWIQNLAAAQALADHLLRDFRKPRPLIRNFSMVSDPRIQLLDRITVLDPDVSQANIDALVVGVHLNLGGTSWTRSLDLRQWNPPRSWVLGVSRLGVDTYL